MDQRFSKYERLKKKKAIDDLFKDGQWIKENNIKLVYKLFEGDGQCRTGFTVPKKKVRKAVRRNRMKRLLREGFRKNKKYLLEELQNNGLDCNMMFIYGHPPDEHASRVEEKIILILNRLRKAISKADPNRGEKE